uniref:Uncharacterized protein n=1 Tax=Parascaris equorum TaxID=6256 RepID=A0A914RHM6_PAREQ
MSIIKNCLFGGISQVPSSLCEPSEQITKGEFSGRAAILFTSRKYQRTYT